eukprot:CAMPEP_0119570218 /NCGR_PEP_ID=MMETSP1352-20130426/43504_1 /TAXON_ID=265584 /ORGANISM="Stauroneis constricta, Strain CCMP1120" /LENGTH=1567 /DNA_ID=CAMNT_0007619885 /DNA_START=651 /DNA_END=5354 /DNA_ORIENTATION=-
MSSSKPTQAPSSSKVEEGPLEGASANDAARKQAKSPEETAWFFSRLYFLWTHSLFQRAADLAKESREEHLSKALEHDDLLPLPQEDQGDVIGNNFERAWNEWRPTKKSKGSRSDANKDGDDANNDADEEEDPTERLRYAIKAVLGRSFWIAGIIKFFNTCLQFAFPLLLNQILLYIEDIQKDEDEDGAITDDDPWGVRYRGYWLSGLLLLAMAAKAVTENVYFHRVYRSGYQARVAVSVAVYNKSLRLANAERQSTTLGELVNLMQVDATKIEMFVPQIHVLWDGLLQIIGYMAILYSLISWPCLVGLAVMIVAAPVQGIVMGKLFGLNRVLSKHTDTRVKSANEALQGIQSVKMYTWEQSVQDEINKSRNQELGVLRGVAYLRGFSRAYMSAIPGLVAVAAFVCLALASDQAIKASTLFAALTAFDQLRFPLLFYPMSLATLAQAKVSATRLQAYLSLREITSMGNGPSSASPSKGASKTNHDGHSTDEDDHATAPNKQMITPITGTHARQSAVSTSEAEIVISDANIYWGDPNTPITDKSDKGETEPHSSHLDMTDRSAASKDDGDTKSVASSQDLESLGTALSSVPVKYPKAILSNISIHVQPGQLCAVVGRVASGKSTLVSAILNETILQSGSIKLAGSVAYAAQTPWILNATLRDNILFGQPYNEERYQRVLSAAQLTHDLELLDGGDMVEIGEKGINLSGGQKQRVSIARAAYSNAQIVILDDPLSALDPEVGRQVFEDCIVDLMQGKTRLLVTNQLQFLPQCDHIVALKRGKIVEQGTYDDLQAEEEGEVHRLLKDITKKQQQKEKAKKKAEEAKAAKLLNDTAMFKTMELANVKATKSIKPDGSAAPEAKIATSAISHSAQPTKTGAATDKPKATPTAAGGLVTVEERNMGAVSLSVYLKYLAAGGGTLKFMIVLLGFIIGAANTLVTGAWISIWTSDADYEDRSQGFYLSVYAALAVALGITTFIRSVLLVRFGISASSSLHHNLIHSILRAPQSFFDTTPIGRILSRFSKDMYSIDIELSDFMDFVIFCWLQVLVSLGTILFVTPYFGIFVLPLGFMYVKFMNYFRNVSRETKRLESISRSPVYAQFSETLGGLTTIRAYDQPARFVSEFEQKVDQNTRATYCNRSADRWLAVRLESIGAMIAGLAAVLASNVALTTDDTNYASLAGLSLTFAVSITGLLNFGVRSFASLEAAMNSCERILYYSEQIPQEAPFTSQELSQAYKNHKRDLTKKSSATSDESDDSKSTMPASILAVDAKGGATETMDASWPQSGGITLKNLKMRYRSDTPLVLKGLDVTIQGGERVGVVGRTGSGKSSLLLCLLRLVEPDLTERDAADYASPISIDGVDTLRIGLKELRSKLGIIPQNPVLFSGTIRSNIDPFNDYSDDQIWTALEQCGMRESVEAMPGLLEAVVSEYGENLSAGMRQLLVLGRALLKQCRILLLDEATSSVDYETDKEIQRTIREAFKGCTVLTIAHRINTIMDSDKILVMKDGLVGEFASPEELLADTSSIFYDIVRHAQANEGDDDDDAGEEVKPIVAIQEIGEDDDADDDKSEHA